MTTQANDETSASNIDTEQKDDLHIGKIKLTKKQAIIIGCLTGVFVIVAIALIVFFVLRNNSNPPEEMITDEKQVDYSQTITSEDGGEFNADYQSGSEQSFAVRFSDLECTDDCSNISEVRVGNRVLVAGKDYEVKKGSVIIVLTEEFMESLAAGDFDLVIAISDGDETTLYGVKFTVEPEPTCNEDETLEKGECIKEAEEPAETDTSTGNSGTSSSQPTCASDEVLSNGKCVKKVVEQPSAQRPTEQPAQGNQSGNTSGGNTDTPTIPSKSQAEIDCENKAAPVFIKQVHWYSAAEKQQNGFQDDMVVGIANWTVQAGVSMRYVNGACHPALKQGLNSGFITGTGLMPNTLSNLNASSDAINKVIASNQNKDMIIWYWTYSDYTIEYTSNINGIWSY